MNTVVKLLLGGAALFFVLGGPGVIKKKGRGRTTAPDSTIVAPTPAPTPPANTGGDAPQPVFRSGPFNQIKSQDWLQKNGTFMREVQAARLTYYLIAKSDRTHLDSVSACLKQAVLGNNIDAQDFQYTYFLDRVLLNGGGVMNWQGKRYRVTYDKLRAAGWASGARDIRNNYTCSGFNYRSKNAVAFIRQNLSNENLFIPLEKARFPNGAAVSGQPIVDWQTISVNPRTFPLSVPEPRRRQVLTDRYSDNALAPAPRSFVVIQTQDGKMFLTEAADTGGGVKDGWIDWRIGNTSGELKYFFSLGTTVKAWCYTFDDPGVTFDHVFQRSQPVQK